MAGIPESGSVSLKSGWDKMKKGQEGYRILQREKPVVLSLEGKEVKGFSQSLAKVNVPDLPYDAKEEASKLDKLVVEMLER